MELQKRIWIGLAVLGLIVLAVVGIDGLRRLASARRAAGQGPAVSAVTLVPGSVPVYFNGSLVAGFAPTDLKGLQQASFIEPVEGKTEEGWMLRDVLRLYLKPAQLQLETLVIVSSSSRQKSARLTWAEIDAEQNKVLFDLAGRGTLKLVSKLEKLDTREEWVQDVDKIEVSQP